MHDVALILPIISESDFSTLNEFYCTLVKCAALYTVFHCMSYSVCLNDSACMLVCGFSVPI